MTLLVIDDDETEIEKLRIICTSLEYPSVEYLSATGVEKALKLVSETVIDLVLSDLRLLDGSGFDVLHGVKALNPAISVVVMTAYRSRISSPPPRARGRLPAPLPCRCRRPG